MYEEEKVAPQNNAASRIQNKKSSIDQFTQNRFSHPMGMISAHQSDNKLSQAEANDFFNQLAEGTVAKSGAFKNETQNQGILMKPSDPGLRSSLQQTTKIKKKVEATPIPGNMFE